MSDRHERQPCKIGTIPMLVWLHRQDAKTIAPGRYVRVKYAVGGCWEQVLVTRVDPDGYFMANR